MAERSVSVFGGTGFPGGSIVRKLAASGWHVRAVARHPEKADFPEVRPDLLQAQPAWVEDVAQAIAHLATGGDGGVSAEPAVGARSESPVALR